MVQLKLCWLSWRKLKILINNNREQVDANFEIVKKKAYSLLMCVIGCVRLIHTIQLKLLQLPIESFYIINSTYQCIHHIISIAQNLFSKSKPHALHKKMRLIKHRAFIGKITLTYMAYYGHICRLFNGIC